jgi:hypothetical protein
VVYSVSGGFRLRIAQKIEVDLVSWLFTGSLRSFDAASLKMRNGLQLLCLMNERSP